MTRITVYWILGFFFVCLVGTSAFQAQAAQGARTGTQTLDTVVVTASRTQEKLREVTSNVTIISQDMIQKSTATNMSGLLRQQGFQVSGSAGGLQRLSMRGMRDDLFQNYGDLDSRSLILFNGRRLGHSNLDFIGLANVERIEIIRGPSAVQYGPAAMGGVVNIITKRGGETPEARLEAGGGSYGSHRIKAAAGGQSEGGFIDVSAGVSQQYQGDYKTGKGWVWKGSRPGNHLGFNGDVGINFLGGHRFGFDVTHFNVTGARTPVGEPSYDDPVKPRYAGRTNTDLSNSNAAFTYDGASSDKAFTWQGRFSFGQFKNEPSSVYEQWYKDLTWMDDARSKNTIDLKQLTATLGYDAGGLFALSGGLDYLFMDTKYSSFSSWGDSKGGADYENFGAFLSGKLRFLDDSLIFSAGGRFDSYDIKPHADFSPYNKISKTNFSPSIGLAYLPVDWLKLRTNYSQGFKMPSPNDLWGGFGGTYVPNPDLRPEKSKTWEIGLDVNWEFFNAGLTYFHSSVQDKLAIQSLSGNRWRSVNLKDGTIAGYELALSADLGQALQQDFVLRPYVNLTYLETLRNKDRESASYLAGYKTLPYTSRMTMNYGLDFVMPSIDLTANVNATYAGRKVVDEYDLAWNQTWFKHTPGTIVDMSIEQGIVSSEKYGTLKIRAEVNNIFDRYDLVHIGNPGPGRNFYLGLVYTF